MSKDATLSIDLLCALPNCNGRIAGKLQADPSETRTNKLSTLRISPSLATGMCLGGHLVSPTPHPTDVTYLSYQQAFRAAFDPRVLSSVCFFATDIHTASLGKGKNDDTLVRVQNGDLTGKGELVMIFGKQDTHVPRAGRDLIRKSLEDANVTASVLRHGLVLRIKILTLSLSQFLEVQAQHAFIRDESSKGRWDAALTRSLFIYLYDGGI
ncbi:hypothetical protein NLI96_g8712 [Meripilus lineatus]|uniref:Uncharacterized protein n=1 Tax=Meripilus lineatus TaxID=2056292 RepID=A0AAD5UWS0_9APHY|nr:hypothetical protein NLI96_g8712 [Physisporinus lineatus]